MATIRLSSKGQVVIPTAVRRALRLEAGDRLRITVEGRRLVIEPEEAESARLVKERGRNVLVAPAGAPAMTTAAVKAVLSDYP
jgi:AbrB family looped-hinge helix DNA binding protein